MCFKCHSEKFMQKLRFVVSLRLMTVSPSAVTFASSWILRHLLQLAGGACVTKLSS